MVSSVPSLDTRIGEDTFSRIGEDLSVLETGPEVWTLCLVWLISGEAKDTMNHLICIYF